MNMGLRPFKSGESGNPGGRKRKPMIDKMLEEGLTAKDSEKAKQIADKLISSAVHGSIAAAKLIAERVEGKVMRSAGDPEKGAAKLTADQIDARLAELLADPEVKQRIVARLATQEPIN
jgi:hypothetical protein